MNENCPGSKGLRQPTPKDIKCPNCLKDVEIWSDEIKAMCPHCKTIIMQNQAMSCVEWCKFAKDCVGEQLYDKYMQNKLRMKNEKTRRLT